MQTQVLVVGAGPVGLTMAAELARYGVSVRIVDKAAERSDKSKALVLWSRTMELLDHAGCVSAFTEAGHKVIAADIIVGDTQLGRVGFESVQSSFNYALMLPQSDTERLLDAHMGELGVTVDRQVELAAFTDTGAGVMSTLRHRDGREERLDAEWLVGCDGAHSTVRQQLGLSFEGDTLQSDWVLADIHMAGWRLPETDMAIYWHEDGVLVVFPISPGRFRVVADKGRADGERPADPALQDVQAIVDRRGPGGLVLSNPVWLSAFRINERKVADYRSGRVFVAGDAAHVHSPAGGQGMNTGMQDAFNLAWKLAMVCRGTCAAEPLLDSYSAERSAVGAQVLADAGRLTAIGVMRNHTAQIARNLVGGFLLGLAPFRRMAADQLSEITVGYPHSPPNGRGAQVGGLAPGQRVPPVAGQTPFGAGDTPRFALCAVPGEAAASLLAERPDLLEPALRPPLANGGICLVRPDGYIAVVARDRDPQPVADYLRAFGRPH